MYGIPWRVALALQADGWYLRSDIIWAKKNCMPESVTDRPTKSHEYIFLLSKSPKYYYDQEAVREPNSENTHGGLSSNVHKLWQINGASASTTLGTSHNGRNKRSVWTIATTPYKEAHFAVFPSKLIEPCILAGCPSRVCVECGEPWMRAVEREKGIVESADRPKVKGQGGYGSNSSTLSLSGGSQGWDKRGSKTKTTGHAPQCQCNAPHQPGIVLDPFFGSGTVGEVCVTNGRWWLGIELNAEYIELAEKRIAETQPALFV